MARERCIDHNKKGERCGNAAIGPFKLCHWHDPLSQAMRWWLAGEPGEAPFDRDRAALEAEIRGR